MKQKQPTLRKRLAHRWFQLRYQWVQRQLYFLCTNAGRAHYQIKRAERLRFKADVLLFGKEHALVRKERKETR